MRQMKGDVAGKEIKRLWGDVPVVDAEKELRVFIIPEDVEDAVPKEPQMCVFARACKRAFGIQKVLFFRTIAYVELPQEDGSKKVERFHMTPAMRELVASFDRGDGVIPKAGFILRPCKPSRRLDSQIREDMNRKHDRRRKERASLDGERADNSKTHSGRNESEPIVIDVRSGVGAVHFTAKAKKRRKR